MIYVEKKKFILWHKVFDIFVKSTINWDNPRIAPNDRLFGKLLAIWSYSPLLCQQCF